MMIALIVVVFILVISVFNLLMADFIGKRVNEQLKGVTNLVTQDNNFLQNSPPPDRPNYGRQSKLIPDMRRLPREVIGKADSIIISDKYDLVFPDEDMIYIPNYKEILLFADQLKNESIDLNQKAIMKQKSSGREYYYVSFPIPISMVEEPSFFIYMIDLTSITSFSDRINMVLLIVMLLACLLAAGSSIFLSGVLAKPVKELTQFALRIGNGDFTRSNLNYRDEELSRLAETMNKAANQLETYDQEQKIFFQNASHELRTPLQSIKCNAEGIKKGIIPCDCSSDIIINETNRLSEMVDDLLYTSYIDSSIKSIKLEEQDLRELLSNSVERLRSLTTEKGIQLDFNFDDQPVMMKCDEKRLNRAFTNILTNAIRYAKQKITLSCNKKSDGIIITIIDDGDGISSEDLPHIFTRFYAGKRGNHGIGLSIVKSIIEQHHGKIELQSSQAGTIFQITFLNK
jgi:signal transduction histidine kinase